VPWLLLKDQLGLELRYLGVSNEGLLDVSNLDRLVDGVKLVGVTAASNVLGCLTPVRLVADAAHAAGAVVVVDGTQLTPHLSTDVQSLGADFYGFTGHKMLGPTGVGVLWGREALLADMPPFLGGGEMIKDVRLDGFEPTDLPWKFEAGTPPIAEAIGLGAAIDYLQSLGMDNIRAHERSLTEYALRVLPERYGADITIHGPHDPQRRTGVMSFGYKGIHPHDLSQVLDESGVCVRAGHHCAKPLMRRLGVAATARASWYVYNDEADIDALADALVKASDLFT
jgi:cysteine desulfurase/selenocysteine lyase